MFKSTKNHGNWFSYFEDISRRCVPSNVVPYFFGPPCIYNAAREGPSRAMPTGNMHVGVWRVFREICVRIDRQSQRRSSCTQELLLLLLYGLLLFVLTVVKLIGYRCDVNASCCFCHDYVTHSECVDSTCRCLAGYHNNSVGNKCLPSAPPTTSPGGEKLNDGQWKKLCGSLLLHICGPSRESIACLSLCVCFFHFLFVTSLLLWPTWHACPAGYTFC